MCPAGLQPVTWADDTCTVAPGDSQSLALKHRLQEAPNPAKGQFWPQGSGGRAVGGPGEPWGLSLLGGMCHHPRSQRDSVVSVSLTAASRSTAGLGAHGGGGAEGAEGLCCARCGATRLPRVLPWPQSQPLRARHLETSGRPPSRRFRQSVWGEACASERGLRRDRRPSNSPRKGGPPLWPELCRPRCPR